MIWDIVQGIFIPLGWGIFYGFIWRGQFFKMWRYSASGGTVIGAVLTPVHGWWHESWGDVLGCVISWILAIVIGWYWRRKKRRSAAELLGAKTRALRDALVRKTREVAIPRRVLVPGGAHAA